MATQVAQEEWKLVAHMFDDSFDGGTYTTKGQAIRAMRACQPFGVVSFTIVSPSAQRTLYNHNFVELGTLQL